MNEEQYKRYRKMQKENLKCLFSKRDKSGNMHFLINGSTGSNYKVSIYIHGKITCTCPDFTHNSTEKMCVCKHCLTVIYNQLEVFSDLNHLFFSRLFFTPDEIQTIAKIYKNSKN